MDKNFKIYETKLKLFARDRYTCKACGNSIHSNGTPQLAHIIPQSEMYLKKYGMGVIYHDDNMASVCSLKCNAKISINGKHKKIDDLVKKIRKKLDKD